MTRGRVAAVITVLSSVSMACAPRSITLAEVRVALHARATRTSNPEQYVHRGTRLSAVVREDTAFSLTLASIPASRARETFVAALVSGARPAIGEEVRLQLPPPDVRFHNKPVEIVLFDDADGNERWDPGEPWVSAWNGSRGSYFLIALTEPRADLPGSREGWNLCEGGAPADCSGNTDRVVILVPGVNEPIASPSQAGRRGALM
jgi:hypothetical protein